MKRSFETEILDAPNIPEQLADRAYRDLTRLHSILGDTRAVIHAIRRDPLPVRRLIDIGCARGALSIEVQHALNVEVIGIDLARPKAVISPISIIAADAARDVLPMADVAYCVHVAHHLSEAQLIAMIRNV